MGFQDARLQVRKCTFRRRHPQVKRKDTAMKRKIILIGALLTLGASLLLSGCGEKPVIVQEGEMGQKLIDQARDAVNQSNPSQQSDPDALLNSLTGE